MQNFKQLPLSKLLIKLSGMTKGCFIKESEIVRLSETKQKNKLFLVKMSCLHGTSIY